MDPTRHDPEHGRAREYLPVRRWLPSAHSTCGALLVPSDINAALKALSQQAYRQAAETDQPTNVRWWAVVTQPPHTPRMHQSWLGVIGSTLDQRATLGSVDQPTASRLSVTHTRLTSDRRDADSSPSGLFHGEARPALPPADPCGEDVRLPRESYRRRPSAKERPKTWPQIPLSDYAK
jgi:hypothetical protein